MEFRKDINGLRAYAVMAVILFHFRVPGFDGGFAGVDIFFVISGFLMTGILLGKAETGPPSILSFYLNRARRIIPALAVLCLTLLTFGWFSLGPSDYGMLAHHAESSLLFMSNFVYWDEDGYFDTPSRYKWLLHTWSLSVEWQFYILYPLVLAAARRWLGKSEKIIFILIGILALASLALSIDLTPSKSAFSFYMLPARAWELLAGGMVYIAARHVRTDHRIALIAELAGILALAASVILFDAASKWPGYAALLPVGGTCLIIMANRRNSILTSSLPAQKIGTWSYSIYLWHWPIVVALGYFFPDAGPVWRIAGIAVSLVIGGLSYAAVEQPARRAFKKGLLQPALAAAALVAIVAVPAAVIRAQDGFAARVPEAVRLVEQEAKNDKGTGFGGQHCGFNRKKRLLTPCRLGTSGQIKAAVWGDSHAGAVVRAIKESVDGDIMLYSKSCGTILHTEMKSKPINNFCSEFNDQAFAYIKALPSYVPVIIVNRFAINVLDPPDGSKEPFGFIYLDEPEGQQEDDDTYSLYRKHLTGTLCAVAAGRPVYVVKPIPEMETDVPRTMVRELMSGQHSEDISIPLADHIKRNELVDSVLNDAAQRCGIHLLDPVPYLCSNGQCRGSEDGHPLYSDDDHLGPYGNRKLVAMFRNALSAGVTQTAAHPPNSP